MARIVDMIDADSAAVSVLVSTQTVAGEELHYQVTRGDERVRVTLMYGDTPEAAQARDQLSMTSIDLTPPEHADAQ
jgi:hypothetical protein